MQFLVFSFFFQLIKKTVGFDPIELRIIADALENNFTILEVSTDTANNSIAQTISRNFVRIITLIYFC